MCIVMCVRGVRPAASSFSDTATDRMEDVMAVMKEGNVCRDSRNGGMLCASGLHSRMLYHKPGMVWFKKRYGSINRHM